MLTIEDIQSPQTYIAYWDELTEQYPVQQGYLSNLLFQDYAAETDTVGLVYGANLNIRGLSASDYDTDVTNLNNIGFTAKYVPIPLFKNQKLMSEKRRRDIARALSNNPAQGVQQGVVKTQLQDVNQLYYDALFTRERMAMEALLTGKVTYGGSLAGTIDFGIPANHFVNAATPWGDKAGQSSPLHDIQFQAQHILDENSTVIRYAIMNTKTWIKLQHSGDIINGLAINRTNTNIALPQGQVTDYFESITGVTPIIYNKQDGNGNKLVPDDKVILTPDFTQDGGLGRMAHTITPEESMSSMGGFNAQVSVTGDGVALMTYHKQDPVGMMYKASEQVLPVLDKAHNILVMDVAGADVTWGNFNDLDNANGSGANDPSAPKSSASTSTSSASSNSSSSTSSSSTK